MIKLITKKGKRDASPKFKDLKSGDTFRITQVFSYDKNNIYMKTWEGFVCIIGENLGSTWSGSYGDWKIAEVKLEAKEL